MQCTAIEFVSVQDRGFVSSVVKEEIKNILYLVALE
jgi:hypothetical protein